MSNLRLLDPVFSNFPFSPMLPLDGAVRRFLSGQGDETPTLRMPMDVAATDAGYLVKADLPGVAKDDIRVEVDGNVVRISAETRPEGRKDSGEPGEGQERLLRRERHQGSITRAFSLDAEIDESKVEAKLADGVLTLLLPKKAAAAARKIAIQ